MELLQLKYFCHAAQSCNFSKTAEKFGVPASGISLSIKRLEKELNTNLFDRKSNKIFLNESGRLFYEKANKALLLLDDAVSEVSDSGTSGKIRISIAANRRIVISAIKAFMQIYPGVDFIMDYSLPENPSEYDFIISDDAFSHPGFEKQKLLSERILLAFPKGDALEKTDNLTPEMLEKASVISMPENSSLARHTYVICKKIGFKPHIVIQCDDPFYIRKCIENGLGIAFVPEISWRGQLESNTVLRSVVDYNRDTYLYRNCQKYASKVSSEFVKQLCGEFAEEQ